MHYLAYFLPIKKLQYSKISSNIAVQNFGINRSYPEVLFDTSGHVAQ